MSEGPEDLSDKVLRALAQMHPRRPDRAELIAWMESAENGDGRKMAIAKRLGWLVASNYIEETLTINTSSPRVGLPGMALIGILLNIEALRQTGKNQHTIIDEVLEKTREFVTNNFPDTKIPPIVIREINIVHGSEQFDILLNISHSQEMVTEKDWMEAESILTYYVRDVLQTRVEGIAGTRTMMLASSRAYPTYQETGNRARKASGRTH